MTVARLLLALALASCPAAAAAAVPDAGSARPPARLLVSAKEYSLTLSRARVVRGMAVIQLLNRGEDDHDLRLRRISGTSRPTARWRVTSPASFRSWSCASRAGATGSGARSRVMPRAA